MSQKTDRDVLLKKHLANCARAERIRKQRMDQRVSNLSARDREAQRKALVADVLRVFHDPNNPYRGFAASRQRYRQLGHFSEVHVFDHFGTHEEFLREADLKDARGTSGTRLAVSRVHTEQKIAKYASEHVLRWQGKFDGKLRDKRGEKLAVILSDLHTQFLDPFAWRVAIDTIKMVKPDVVILNGDVVDFHAVSRHCKLPGDGALSLQGEINFAKNKILAEVRAAAPDADITWHIGNHEYRLVRYLADTAPELADLECLAFDKLFGIKEYEIEMIFGGSFLAPKVARQRQEIGTNWHKYWDCYAVTHGTYCGPSSAFQHLSRYGMSGTNGHAHAPVLVFKPTLVCPSANWMVTGMMAGFAVGKDYVPEPSQWTRGFGVATIHPSSGVVIQVPVVMQGGFATFAGHSWHETEGEKSERLKMWR